MLPEACDGKCIECNGFGHYVAEPAFIYGSGKIKCRACNGTGLLEKPTKCKWCGYVKQPKIPLSSPHAETLP